MIKIDRDNLLTNKADLDKAKEDFNELITRMQTIVDQLPDNWEGEASKAYVEQFGEVKNQALQPVAELLESISNQIQQVCDNAEEFDSSMANQIR